MYSLYLCSLLDNSRNQAHLLKKIKHNLKSEVPKELSDNNTENVVSRFFKFQSICTKHMLQI
jgi:hypothetical protein